MISVIIRVKEEAHHIKILLPILRNQSVDCEIIVVDSHSKDNLTELTNKYECKVIQATEPFSYGGSLNEGIEASKGTYICILSAHCFPTDTRYLENMVSNFKDSTVAGVYSRQIPHNKTNELEYRNFIYTYGNERRVQTTNYKFNNGASMIRKSVWEEIPFDEVVVTLEDLVWAKKVLDSGMKIVYDPVCIVEHLHDEDIDSTVKRHVREYKSMIDIGVIGW